VTAPSTSPDEAPGGIAIITGAHLSPSHDGSAEAVIDVTHPNGATHSVVFPVDALAAVMDRHGLASLDELCTLPWTILVDEPQTGET
jgi:hypothetical protein